MLALIYMSKYPELSLGLTNTIKDSKSLEELNQMLQPANGYLTIPDVVGTQRRLDDILKRYNLKRGCCLQIEDPTNPNNYLVKILDKTTKTFSESTAQGKVWNKIGYYDRNLSFPKTLCSNVSSNFLNPKSFDCKNFYATYCSNISKLITDVYGTFNYDAALALRPECACFFPKPEFLKKFNVNVAPKCYYPNCKNVKGVILDPLSESEPNCYLSLCNSDIDIGNAVNLDGEQKIVNNVKLYCGSGGTQPIEDVSTETSEEPTNTYLIYGGFASVGLVITCLFVIIIIVVAYFIMRS